MVDAPTVQPIMIDLSDKEYNQEEAKEPTQPKAARVRSHECNSCSEMKAVFQGFIDKMARDFGNLSRSMEALPLNKQEIGDPAKQQK